MGKGWLSGNKLIYLEYTDHVLYCLKLISFSENLRSNLVCTFRPCHSIVHKHEKDCKPYSLCLLGWDTFAVFQDLLKSLNNGINGTYFFGRSEYVLLILETYESV